MYPSIPTSEIKIHNYFYRHLVFKQIIMILLYLFSRKLKNIILRQLKLIFTYYLPIFILLFINLLYIRKKYFLVSNNLSLKLN